MRLLRRRVTVHPTTVDLSGIRLLPPERLELWFVRLDDGQVHGLPEFLPVIHDDDCQACWS